MDRPITTLFLLSSVDGKISTGSTDNMDVDTDYPKIDGVKEGLHQYYEIERTTDLWSLNSGRVQAKLGVNEKALPQKSHVSFVIIDNHHLTKHGVEFFCALSKQFVLVTSNEKHPAFKANADNLGIIFQNKFDPEEMLVRLKQDYGCERITIQTGGTLNEVFLRSKQLDYIDIVVAPVLIGGKDTSSVIDGNSLTDINELGKVGVLELISCEQLKCSYLRLRYKVIK
jgi:2,5-diamino-6-(ribosylamino)-4(3H)-pyrimidinone 5'-phosphate reductase